MKTMKLLTKKKNFEGGVVGWWLWTVKMAATLVKSDINGPVCMCDHEHYNCVYALKSLVLL